MIALNSSSLAYALPIITSSTFLSAMQCFNWDSIGQFLCSSTVGNPSLTGHGPCVPGTWLEIKIATGIPLAFQYSLISLIDFYEGAVYLSG